MPLFKPNVPVETREPVVVVEPPLSPGRHRFQLVVVDDRGRESEPAFVVVLVKPRGV